MTALVACPVQALVNMSITIQRLMTSPCCRLAGAGHEVSLPVSSTFWKGFTRGSMSHSGALSKAWRYGTKYMSPDAIQGRYCFGSMIQRRKSLDGGIGGRAEVEQTDGKIGAARPLEELGERLLGS